MGLPLTHGVVGGGKVLLTTRVEVDAGGSVLCTATDNVRVRAKDKTSGQLQNNLRFVNLGSGQCPDAKISGLPLSI